MNRFDIFRFLCLCLIINKETNDNVQQIQENISNPHMNWQQLLEIANEQFVLPSLYLSLSRCQLFDQLNADIRDRLFISYKINSERNRRLKKQAIEIIRALNSINVEPVLLKGVATLFTDIYDDPGLRMMLDLDFLVPENRLLDCVHVLKTAGYRPVDDGHYSEFDHHFPALICDGCVAPVELHKNIVIPDYNHFFPNGKILCNTEHLLYESLRAKIPNPHLFALHNIIHNQLSDWGHMFGQIKLYQLYDLVMLRNISENRINWRLLCDDFDRYGYGKALRSYLILSEKLFDQARPAKIKFPVFSNFVWHRYKAQMEKKWLMAASYFIFYYGLTFRYRFSDPARRKALAHELLKPATFIRHFNHLKNTIKKAFW